MIPFFLYGGDHMTISWFISGTAFFFGSLLISLWAPTYNVGDEYARKMIQGGFYFYGAAALGLVFGIWSLCAELIVLLIFLIKYIFKGIKILKNND